MLRQCIEVAGLPQGGESLFRDLSGAAGLFYSSQEFGFLGRFFVFRTDPAAHLNRGMMSLCILTI